MEWIKTLSANRTAGKNAFFSTVSDLNAPLTIGLPTGWLAAGLVNKDPRLMREGITWVVAQIVNGGLTFTLKAAFDRPRPNVTDPTLITLQRATSPAFPSGHTSSAFALATSVSLDHPKWFVIAPAYLYASLVGYSRCYLGVHYPSDVLAGAVLGSASALVTHQADRWLHQKKFRKKEQIKFSYLY